MRTPLVTLLCLGGLGTVIYLITGTVGTLDPQEASRDSANASFRWPAGVSQKSWKTLTPEWEAARFQGGALDEESKADWQKSKDGVVPLNELYRSSGEAYDAFSKAARKGKIDVLKQLPGKDDCSWCPSFYDKVEKGLRDSSGKGSWDFNLFSAQALASLGDAGSVGTLINLSKDLPPSEGAAAARAIKELEPTADAVDRLAETLTNEDEERPQMLTDAMVSALTRDGSPEAARALYEQASRMDDPDDYTDVGIGLGAMTPLPETMPFLSEIAEQGDNLSYLAINSMLRFGDQGLRAVFDLLENSPAGEEPTALKGVFASITIESDATKKWVYQQRRSDNPAVKEFAREIVKELEIDIPKKDREIVYTDTFEDGIVWDKTSDVYGGNTPPTS